MLSQLENRASNPYKDHSPILATILYEDLESGLRARALMESVEANMDFPAQFQLDLWRFDWLAERSLGNIALSRADRSALVLISIGSSNPLPAAAENWINTWVHLEQSHPLALVVLLPKEKRGADDYHPLHERLRAVARQKGVDFFCEFFDRSTGYRNVPVRVPKNSEEILAAARQVEFTSHHRGTDLGEKVHPSGGARVLRPVVSLDADEAEQAFGETGDGFGADPTDVLLGVTLSESGAKRRKDRLC